MDKYLIASQILPPDIITHVYYMLVRIICTCDNNLYSFANTVDEYGPEYMILCRMLQCGTKCYHCRTFELRVIKPLSYYTVYKYHNDGWYEYSGECTCGENLDIKELQDYPPAGSHIDIFGHNVVDYLNAKLIAGTLCKYCVCYGDDITCSNIEFIRRNVSITVGLRCRGDKYEIMSIRSLN